jgi:hypothetical protein
MAILILVPKVPGESELVGKSDLVLDAIRTNLP